MVSQINSLANIKTDPLRNFKFQVKITPNAGSAAYSMGCMNVQGLNIQIDVIAYREGGFNTTTQKMPGQADFSPIVLSQGIILGNYNGTPQNISWLKDIFVAIGGTGTSGPSTDFRSHVDIQVLAHPVTTANVPVKAWFRVYNAWPTTVSFSDLDAGANALLINQLTLAHEGWDLKLASGTADASSVSFGA